MSSLRDLIYSQLSAPSEPPPEQQQEDYLDPLDAFYQGGTVSHHDSLSPSPAKKVTKRKRRIKEGEEKEESEEQKRRKRQNSEWQRIRRRWQKKKYDLRDEVDYSGAVAHVAKLAYKKKKQTKVAEPMQKEEQTQPTYVDSSDEERQEQLGSLLTTDDEVQPDLVPSEPVDYTKLDYWSKGYIAPHRPDFTYGRKQEEEPPIVLKANRKHQMLDDEKQESSVVIPGNGRVKWRRNEPFHYFPLRHATKCPTHGTFFHQRNMFLMAARCIVGQSNDAIENRLLRALHRRSQREAHRIQILLEQARERAKDLLLYYSHHWKESPMKELGLGPKHEYTGPPHALGSSLRPVSVYDDAYEARSRIVKKLSGGKVVEPSCVAAASRNVDALDDGADPDVTMEDSTQSLPNGEEDNGVSRKDALEGKAATNAFLLPTTDFVHEPGSSPPLPCFPLDENTLVFGGPDKYGWVMHTSDVDATTYALTMSVLLSRLSMARQKKDRQATMAVHEQIMSYLEQTVAHISPDRTKLVWMQHHDLPVAPLYMAIMGYCSYLANGGSFEFDNAEFQEERMIERSWSDSDSHDESDTNKLKKEHDSKVATVNVLARLIFDHCEAFIADQRLAPFPRVKLTLGIVRIVMSLPSSAAAILALPCDPRQHRTPFELMQLTLEHMEERRLLVDSHVMFAEEETVNVGQLEHTFYLATDLFKRCLEEDPTEVTYHEWYLAVLAGSLLLCSGNTIGGGARLSPSSVHQDSGYEILLSQDSATERRTGGVRQKMEKFEEVRKLLAESFLALVELAGTQKALRLHLALSSFLEWGEVVALLVGPPSGRTESETNPFREVRRLHAHHTIQWSVRENSASCFRRLQDLLERKEVSVDSTVAVAAGILENDTNSEENWRRLAGAVGPVGCKVSRKQRRRCKKANCAECKRLRRGINIDHCGLEKRKRELGWWGEGRDWWDTEVLIVPPWIKTTGEKDSDFIFRASAAIEKRLVDCVDPCLDDEKESARLFTQGKSSIVGVSATQTMDLSWLQVHLEDGHDFEDDSSDDETPKPLALEKSGHEIEDVCDSYLPSSLAEVMADSQASDRQVRLPQLSRTRRGHDLEILCYKILITCHFHNVLHPMVTECIWFLAKHSWGQDNGVQDCDECRCLVWLYSMGLDLPRILRDFYDDELEKEKASFKQRFRPHQKQAIREGVERFGTDWSKIRSHNDSLSALTNVQIMHSYQRMVRNREVRLPQKRSSSVPTMSVK